VVAVKNYIMRTCSPKPRGVSKSGECVDDVLAGMPRSRTCFCKSDKCNIDEPKRLPSESPRVIYPTPLWVVSVAFVLVLIDL